MKLNITNIFLTLLAILLLAPSVCASAQTKAVKKNGKVFMKYIVEGEDTVYVDQIRPAKIFDRLPKQKGRDWRQYYRLVYNFNKVYPYALVARSIMAETDSTIIANNLKRVKRESFINEKQKELFDAFEEPLKGMTISQGTLLMRLIDRETGKVTYNIIKDYKTGIAAGFWQGLAKLFGHDLKRPYDPNGEDEPTEELVKIWEDGYWEEFYFSIFWQYPEKVTIPEKYL